MPETQSQIAWTPPGNDPAPRRPLKVAVVTAFPEDPERPHGGVEAVSVNLLPALARLDDLEVHVVTTHRDRSTDETGQWAGVRIHRLRWAGGKMLYHAWRSGHRQIVRYLTELRPDVVHAHDTFGIAVRGLALPRVFTAHGFIHVDTRLGGGRLASLRALAWRRLETASWRDQPHIISINPYVRETLAPHATGTMHDIDNPIAPACFEVPREVRTPVVFSAGVLSPAKNTIRLIEAFGRLIQAGTDAELRLAGAPVDPEYQRRIEACIHAAGLADRVRLLGQISAAEVRAHLAAASVFALVSLQENAPMCIAEAMAAGVPVVTSNRCGMPYMVEPGRTGYLVDPTDVDAIAEPLGRLLDDAAACEALGAEARRVALRRYHPTVVAERTRDVYRQAVEAHVR